MADFNRPPTFMVSDKAGCIGRFWWINTVQRPPDWFAHWPFPVWGLSRWYRG